MKGKAMLGIWLALALALRAAARAVPMDAAGGGQDARRNLSAWFPALHGQVERMDAEHGLGWADPDARQAIRFGPMTLTSSASRAPTPSV